ncbi:MAG: YggT family protein [Candidatus Brocadiaceae bacterium]|nr:YggT family protein [Candidatus Brocadiaceae bacterium]
MSLDEKFAPVRDSFYHIVSIFFKKIAVFFGYPNNPGMPAFSYLLDDVNVGPSLPTHKTVWPPAQRPQTWFEMIFGTVPTVEPVSKYIYESKEEGFYNFYVENYRNIYFLPDQVSEFIQIKLNICLDVSSLETIREVLFISLLVYWQLVMIRIALSWFLSINPYTFPWCYIAATVDWTEDILQGLLPSVFGVNITGTIFLGLIGKIADSLNHLILTMPFLPSEGEETKLLIDKEIRDVIVFHYLPVLWYRHPIPNDIREFWYNERPDILNYMQKAYKDFDIQFLPDSVVGHDVSQYIPTEILSLQPLGGLSTFLEKLFSVST